MRGLHFKKQETVLLLAWDMQNEALMRSLKHLIQSFEPHIREAGSWDQTEDVLLHLEENDRNFHRYDFVKLLKKHIADNLGDVVSAQIDKYSTSYEVKGQSPLVSQISDYIINSKEFRDLFREMKISITDASTQLLQNFDTEFCTRLSTLDNPFQNKPRITQQGSDEEDESCFHSLNQGSLVFLSAEYFGQTVENLNKNNCVEMRKEAMNNLNQIPVVDIAGSERWRQLRTNLLDILSDSDQSLANLGMKFVTRAFSTTTPKTSDIYSLLVDHIASQFTSIRSDIPKLTTGLDTSDQRVIDLIRAFRLINEFQKETPTYWIRYPDRYMEEIITSTVSLYSLHSSHSLSPLHFISLLDPGASWFIKWMHVKYSREPLLDKLHAYKPVLENAIRICLSFVSPSKYDKSTTPACDVTSGESGSDTRRTVYREPELHYAYFVHSIHLLGQLIVFSSGRRYFPFVLPDRQEPVITRDVVLCLIKLITSSRSKSRGEEVSFPDSAGLYEPATLATEIIKGVCREEEACRLGVCKDDVIHALVQPIHHALSMSSEARRHRASETTLLHIADILCMIASNADGRDVLLYGEGNTIHNRSRSASVHIIAQFTRKALRNECKHAPSTLVIGDFLYICRQLYSTCGGLVVLHQYALHECIANALLEVKEEFDGTTTPTPSDDGSDQTITSSDAKKSLQWEETLRDNLLNFASTAKGLLLLQQTGVMNDCVFYMYTRYTNKLQVSKCEKFGYGCMVTQVATTAPGMLALYNAGFLNALIDEACSLLECGLYDKTVYTPRVWPVDPIDRHLHKPLLRLLNVLSSFPAVYEVLRGQPNCERSAYGLRDMPTTIADVVDRLVMVTTDAKVHSLFNYEQSHVFGLRLLSVMISCLDTYLLLESHYRFHESFVHCQKLNTTNDSKNIIVDMLSVERNYILVKSFMIGGPSERILPPRELSQDVDQPYPHPMFITTPIPKAYCPSVQTKSNAKQGFRPFFRSNEEENEITKFLVEFKKKGEKECGAWLDKCRECFVTVTRTDRLSSTVIQNLLDQAVTVMLRKGDHTIFPHMDFSANDKSLKGITLSASQQLGVKIASRYGVHLKLVSGLSDSESRLTKLITITTSFLHKQLAHTNSDLHYLQGSYPGFDWFATTVFLVMGGNVDRTWRLLHKLSSLSISAYLWPARLHASVHVPAVCATSGISPIFYRSAHNIELVLQSELPLVVSAFRMSGYTPAQMCVHWLRQCFWNYLDWRDIVEYVCVCLLHGVDYQVYVCVALLSHLKGDILRHTQDQDLIMFLKEEPIRGFRLSDYMEYMTGLEHKFRKIIQPEMLNFTKI